MIDLTARLTSKSNGDWIIVLQDKDENNGYHPNISTDSMAYLLEQMVEAKAQRLIIDLSTTERIDSQGMKILLDMHQMFSKENIPIVLQNPNSHLYRLLQIMQFTHIFEINFDE